MKRALSATLLSLAACSSGSTEDAPVPTAGAPTLDLSHYSAGAPAQLSNSSVIFRPDLAASRRVITGQDDAFREVYNRLTCRLYGDPADPFFTEQAFGGVAAASAAARPLRIESVTVTLLDDLVQGPAAGACFAYHTSDGRWHGQLAPVAGTHDSAAGETRVVLEVHADDVDIVGVMFANTWVTVREVSYVATAPAAP